MNGTGCQTNSLSLFLVSVLAFTLMLASSVAFATTVTANDSSLLSASSLAPTSHKHPYAELSFHHLSQLPTPPVSFISLAKGLVHDNDSFVNPTVGLGGFDSYLDYVDTKVPNYMIQLLHTYPTLKSILIDSKAVVPITFSLAMLALHFVTYRGLNDVVKKTLFANFIPLDVVEPSKRALKRESQAQLLKRQQAEQATTNTLVRIFRAIWNALRSLSKSVFIRVPFGILFALAVTLLTVAIQHFYTIVYFSYASKEDNVLTVYKTATSTILPIEAIFTFLFAIKVATPLYELHDPTSLTWGLIAAFAFYFVRRVFRNAWSLFGVASVPVLFVIIAGIFAYDKDAMRTKVLQPIVQSPALLYQRIYYPGIRSSLSSQPPRSARNPHSVQQQPESRGLNKMVAQEFYSLAFSRLYHIAKMALCFILAFSASGFIPFALGQSSLSESTQFSLKVLSFFFELAHSMVGPIVYRVFKFLAIDFWYTAGFFLICWDGFLFPSVTREASSPVLTGTLYATRNETFLMVLTGAELVFNATDVCLNHALHPLLGPQAPTDFFSAALNMTSFDVAIADSLYHLIHRYGPVHALFHSGYVIPVLYLGVMVYKFTMGFYKKQRELAEKAPENRPVKRSSVDSLSVFAFETLTPIMVLAVVYLAQHVLLQAFVFYYDPAVTNTKTMVRAIYARFTPLSTMVVSALSSSLAVVPYQLFRPISYSFFFSTVYNIGFMYLRAVLKGFMMSHAAGHMLLIEAHPSNAIALPSSMPVVSAVVVSTLAVSLISACFGKIMRLARSRSLEKAKLGTRSGLGSIVLNEYVVVAGIALLFGSHPESPLKQLKSIFSTLQYEFKYNAGYELGSYGGMFTPIDQSISELPLFENLFESTPMLATDLARLATDTLE